MADVVVPEHMQHGHLVRTYTEHRRNALHLSDTASTTAEHQAAQSAWQKTSMAALSAKDQHGFHEASAMGLTHYERVHGGKKGTEGPLTSAEKLGAAQHVRERDREHSQMMREQEAEASHAHAMSGEEAYRSMPEMEVSSDSERRSVHHYLLGGYEPINDGLRDSEGQRVDSHARNLESVIERSGPVPTDLRVHRNVVRATQMFGPVGDRVGEAFTDHGFTSTTTSDTQAEHSISGGGDRAVLHIFVPKGTAAMKIEDPGTHFGVSEREILLQRGTRYRIHSDIVRPDGVREIEMSVEH